jgi:SAM-dependent methyltransferase
MGRKPAAPPVFVVKATRAVSAGLTSVVRRLAPPPIPLLDIVSSQWRVHALGVVARLGIADLLAAGPRDVAYLAIQTGTHEDSLYRLLRALAGEGIFTRPAVRTFGLNSLAAPLRTDHPQSIRHTVIQVTAHWNQRAWSALGETVVDGQPAFRKAFGQELWDYFAEHPDEGEHFHHSMRELSRLELGPLLAAHDFGQYRRIVDIGGGSGQLLAGVLAAHPLLRGVLFDLEPATAGAAENLRRAGVADRAEVIHGSFYEHVPQGYDAYLLRQVIHGHTDEQAKRIFASLRAAITPHARILVVDTLVPDGAQGYQPSFLDLQMLVGSGGRERTRSEMAALFSENGFRLTDVVQTAGISAVFIGQPTH